MLSLFYLPYIIYNLVYNYINPQQKEEPPLKHFKGIQSKYKPENGSDLKKKKPDSKPEKNCENNSAVDLVRIEKDASPSFQSKQSEIVNVTKDNHALSQMSRDDDTTLTPQDPTPTIISENITCSTSSGPNVQIPPRVIVALSGSDSDSDSINEYLADIVSIEPSAAKLDKSSVNPPVTISEIVPVISSPTDNQPQLLKDNCHVVIEKEDEEDFLSTPQNAPVPFINPNSFSQVSKPSSTAMNSDGASSSSPDTELPTYSAELSHGSFSAPSTISQDLSQSVSTEKEDFTENSVTVKFEGGAASISTVSSGNLATAVCTGNGGNVDGSSWGDVPNETLSLTSQKR
jgi:hypothetical protein